MNGASHKALRLMPSSATLKMATRGGRRGAVTSRGPGHGRPGRGKAKFGNVSAGEEVRVRHRGKGTRQSSLRELPSPVPLYLRPPSLYYTGIIGLG